MYMCVNIYVLVHVYMCICIYIYICVCMYVCVYVCMYVCRCMCICMRMYICARVCICVCMYIYVYAYDICIYVGKYVHVCMRTLVDVIEGPYDPLRFCRRGCYFYKSENTESDLYTASPYGLVDLQLPHSFDRRYHIPLSVSVTVVYPPQVVLSCTPTLRTYC